MGIKRKRIPLSQIIYKNDKKYAMDGIKSVSYTHLTLPTKA